MPVPKGTRIGGRQKGTPNKITVEREQEIAASGLTPLDWMLSVLRDPTQDNARRDEMAKSAAPYVHPRLSSIQAQHDMSEALRAWMVGRDG
jgi:hypothetical protein